MRRRLIATFLVLAAGCSTEDAADPPDPVDVPAPPEDVQEDTAPVADTPAPPEDSPAPGPQCQTNADCADKVQVSGPCEIAVCVAGQSVCDTQAVVDGTPCDDDDACTLEDTCLAGACASSLALGCDDHNPCTDDQCDPSTGCTVTNNTAPCDDSLACTTTDLCVDGACVGEGDCGCTADSDCAQDDDLCNGTTVCDLSATPATCVVAPDSVITCETDAPCAVSTCNPQTGECESSPAEDGTSCDDATACTTEDVCTGGACAGVTKTCDDGNECTTDACDPGSGCLFEDNGTCDGCSGLSCLNCFYGADCAPAGAKIGDTCCAKGDALVYLSKGTAAEAVDVEADDKYAYLCGGFGVRVNKISNPASPKYVDSALGRCQRIGLGPTLESGHRVVYFAHHGDSWVGTPFLATYYMQPNDKMLQVDKIDDPQVLFEGMTYHKDHLLVAAHSGGVRVYPTTDGIPGDPAVIDGFDNAWKLDATGDTAYVADAEGGLKVLDVATPMEAKVHQTLPTVGIARDVVVHNKRVYVAMGSAGVAIFDATDPTELVHMQDLQTVSSAQAVAADGGVLAVGAWSHLAMYETKNYSLLGTEDVKYFPGFEQVFGVAMNDGIAYVAEWEGLHIVQHVPGYVAPDLWIEDELVDFGFGSTPTKAVVVRNRGQLPLEITGMNISNKQFSVTPKQLSIAPGDAAVFEVTFYPPAKDSFDLKATLSIFSNDPDPGQNPFKMYLVGNKNKADLNVGDKIGNEFGFLDPTGGGQVSNLKGHVIVLAYFALF